MGTPASISTLTDEGFTTLTVHYDGMDVGKTLSDHYSDPDAVRALIALGDLRGLGDNPEAPYTEAYARDRGEPYGAVGPRTTRSVRAFWDECDSVYRYVWWRNQWWTALGREADKVKLTPLESEVWISIVDPDAGA